MDPLKPTYRIITAALLLTAALVLPAPAAPAAENSPEGLVNGFHRTMLATMRESKALGYQGRFGKLAPEIERSFHLPLMIQVATGSFWKKASEKQQDLLIGAFSRLSIGIYASRFTGYSGQKFVTVGQRPGPQKTVLVKTKIVNPAGKDADITYVTREIKGTWRIIDVLLDTGISELAVRRSEYRRILKSRGIDGLIVTLDDKAAKLEPAS